MKNFWINLKILINFWKHKRLENSLCKRFIFRHSCCLRINMIDTFPRFYQCRYFLKILILNRATKFIIPIWEPRNELLLLPQSNVRNLLLYSKLRHIVRRITHEIAFYLIGMWTRYNSIFSLCLSCLFI